MYYSNSGCGGGNLSSSSRSAYKIKGEDNADLVAIEFLHNGYTVELYPTGEGDEFMLWVYQVRLTGGGCGIHSNTQKLTSEGLCQFVGGNNGGCGII